VQKALAYKADPFKDKTFGSNKRIGCLFLNPSMRTRLSTQIAAQNLGMETIVFNVGNEGWALEFEEEAIMSGSTVEHVKMPLLSWENILIFWPSALFLHLIIGKMITVNFYKPIY
jgi:hypothetical protein